MQLSEFLKKNQITHEKFAELIGVSRTLVTQLVNKRTNTSPQVVRRIEIVTGGEVLFSDLFVDIDSKRIKKKVHEEELLPYRG
jgi:DNA-binding transcriptional regulator YdaS (Cro superfamily)